MPININNMVVGGETVSSAQPAKPIKQASGLAAARVPNSVTDIKGTSLVVDGKVKKISKKSAYLLDMLTLEDE